MGYLVYNFISLFVLFFPLTFVLNKVWLLKGLVTHNNGNQNPQHSAPLILSKVMLKATTNSNDFILTFLLFSFLGIPGNVLLSYFSSNRIVLLVFGVFVHSVFGGCMWHFSVKVYIWHFRVCIWFQF